MSSSIGMMTFPIYGKIKNGNQTTNQIYIYIPHKNLWFPHFRLAGRSYLAKNVRFFVYIISYYIILYHIVLYCIVLYCIVLLYINICIYTYTYTYIYIHINIYIYTSPFSWKFQNPKLPIQPRLVQGWRAKIDEQTSQVAAKQENEEKKTGTAIFASDSNMLM